MMRFLWLLLLAVVLAIPPQLARSENDILRNCSSTIGTAAANVVFTGQTQPVKYLLLQNNSVNQIWMSVLPGVVATTAPPSYFLAPTGGFVFSGTDPIPSSVSLIANTGATNAYTCWFR